MATYVRIHGASSESWYWHRVIPELQRLGHEVVAPDLPSDYDAAGLAEYADTVIDVIGGRSLSRSGSPSTFGLYKPKFWRWRRDSNLRSRAYEFLGAGFVGVQWHSLMSGFWRKQAKNRGAR